MADNKIEARLKISRVLLRNLLVVAGACVMPALSSNVQAAAYAVSTNTITAFNMGLSSGVSFGGFTFVSSFATLGASGTGSGGVSDASASCLGTACTGWNNSFTFHGVAPNAYSYGDAQIVSDAVNVGTGAASSIGESHVFNGTGSGLANNTLRGYLNVTASGTVNFSFMSDLDMWAELTAGGQSASANSSMTITISDFLGNAVFTWAPNGALGNGITGTGATETADAFNLNLGIGQVGSVGVNSNIHTPGLFSATTGLLDVNTYQVNIAMQNNVSVQSAPVPVPAASWLLFSGLAGLLSFARKARK